LQCVDTLIALPPIFKEFEVGVRTFNKCGACGLSVPKWVWFVGANRLGMDGSHWRICTLLLYFGVKSDVDEGIRKE